MTKFTIIVPTRDRALSLQYCLKNLLKQDYQNFEVLVSDNCSQDDTAAVVSAFADARIRYINTGSRISMSHNWEFSLSHVNEGWILFIGDDDGLLPNALGVLDEVIQDSGCEALTTASCIYWWPDHFPFMPDGQLSVPLPSKKLYEIRRSDVVLDKVMNGRVGYQELPWLYNGGACSVALLKRLKALDGRYFRSLNPDIYSAISLGLGTNIYASINIPIAVNGASKFSNGTSSMLGQKQYPESPASKFLTEENIPFHSKLLLGKSFQIMIYECYLQAAHLYAKPAYSISHQLKTALIVAPDADFPQVLSECKMMASLHGVTLLGRFHLIIFRSTNKILGFIRTISRRRVIVVPASQLHAWNVDVACDAAKYLYGMFDYFSKQSLFTRITLYGFAFLTSLGRYSRRLFSKYR